MQLEEQFYESDWSKWQRSFPWLHVFRVPRMALNLRCLCLGAMAMMLLAAGHWAISQLPFASASIAASSQDSLSLSGSDIRWPWDNIRNYPRLTQFAAHPSLWPAAIQQSWSFLMSPFTDFVNIGGTITGLFSRQTPPTWARLAEVWTRVLWHLVVWSIFGGAIARIVALQFSGHGSVSAADALKYSAKRFLSYLTAPLIPLAAVAILWGLSAIVGLGARFGSAGEMISGVLYLVPLICGVGLFIVVLGIGLGWPLMVSTVSTEDSDAFDAVARAYHYWFTRPWYLGWLILLLVSLGTFTLGLITWAGESAATFAAMGVATTAGDEAATRLEKLSPFQTPRQTSTQLSANPSVLVSDLSETAELSESQPAGAVMAGIWLRLLGVLVAGFTASFFWTGVTAAYFLVRKSADAKPLTDVAVPRAEKPGPALVGTAAVHLREQQTQKSTSENVLGASAAPGSETSTGGTDVTAADKPD